MCKSAYCNLTTPRRAPLPSGPHTNKRWDADAMADAQTRDDADETRVRHLVTTTMLLADTLLPRRSPRVRAVKHITS